MPSLIPLDNLLGAAFIGIMISTAMYGITCLQTYLYYTEYSQRDLPIFKSLVAFLMSLNTLHVVLLAMFYYHYTVTNFGDYEALATSTWSLLVQVIVGDLIGLLVRTFFIYRIYRFNEKRLLVPGISLLLNLAAFSVGTAFAVKSMIKRLHFMNDAVVTPYITPALALDTACDMLIAASLVHSLRKKVTNVRSTDRAIGMLIAYALNTCILTNICTLASLITWALFTDTLIYSPFYFIYVQLYTCSFMSTLNSREALRENLEYKRDDSGAIIFTTLNSFLPAISSSVNEQHRDTSEAKAPALTTDYR